MTRTPARTLAVAAALALASGFAVAKLPQPELTPEQKAKAEEAKAKAAEAAKKNAELQAKYEDLVVEKYKKSLAAKAKGGESAPGAAAAPAARQ